MLATAALTALAMLVLTGSPASAAEPGESNTWIPELENGAQLHSSDTVGEARDPDNGNLVQVWRSDSDNTIWVSLNNGEPVLLPTAQTYVAPRVVRYGGHFHVFHTGTDGRVYEMALQFSGSTTLAANQPNSWAALPNQAVTRNSLSPSVIAIHDNQAMLAWGSATDNTQWVMFFTGSAWQAPAQVPDVQSTSASTLSWDAADGEVILAHRGLDGHVYIQYQPYGSGQWSTPFQISGVTVTGTPSVAWTDYGAALIQVTSGDAAFSAHHYGGTGLTAWSAWSLETTHRRPLANTWLTVAGNTIFTILTDYSTHNVYYKQMAKF
ncbi:hypothetical protein ABZ595_19625 [Streptomyces rubradiris]|uniref:hypothetical protein n=1 Tax=Streptomyces rubradiris TaxID=285531 RepID=UPI00340EC367